MITKVTLPPPTHPPYNHTGWLGVIKHQLTYYPPPPSVCFCSRWQSINQCFILCLFTVGDIRQNGWSNSGYVHATEASQQHLTEYQSGQISLAYGQDIQARSIPSTILTANILLGGNTGLVVSRGSVELNQVFTQEFVHKHPTFLAFPCHPVIINICGKRKHKSEVVTGVTRDTDTGRVVEWEGGGGGRDGEG